MHTATATRGRHRITAAACSDAAAPLPHAFGGRRELTVSDERKLTHHRVIITSQTERVGVTFSLSVV